MRQLNTGAITVRCGDSARSDDLLIVIHATTSSVFEERNRLLGRDELCDWSDFRIDFPEMDELNNAGVAIGRI